MSFVVVPETSGGTAQKPLKTTGEHNNSFRYRTARKTAG
jgi:hypothetical protein